jgi:hypothetical protein
MAQSDGENIYSINGFANTRQIIGVMQSKYDELAKICQGYYDKLVELKVIIPPKTPEELQAEQNARMADMLELIKELKTEVEVLRNGRDKRIKNVEFQSGTDTEN